MTDLTTWVEGYVRGGDLAAAYERLRVFDGWWVEALRGRCAGLLLRLELAQQHFLAAAVGAASAAATPKNIGRAIQLDAMTVHAELGIKAVKELIHEFAIESELESQPPVRMALTISQGINAKVELALGRNVEALQRYEQVLPRYPQGMFLASHAIWHCGAACACHNLGLGRCGDQHLRSAEYCAQHLRPAKLNALHVAALLRAIYSEMGDRRAARRWMVFLRHLRCARETEEALLRRGSMMVERCQQQEERRLVVL